MYRFLLLIVFCVITNLSWAQTPDDLIRDIRENTGSASRFMNALQKHAQNLDSMNNGWYDTASLLGHTLYENGYRYNTSVIRVHAVYRGDELGYVRLIAGYADTVFKYVNHDHTTRVLNEYNTSNNTDFTWRDLYEDNLNYFDGLPGLYETPKPLTPEEMEKGILRDDTAKVRTTKEYEPILVKRDHKTIIKHCKSFNPARKAYGTYCLYLLKQEGVPLSEEEDELFKKISGSNEKTDLHAGCLGYRNVRLSSFLCREHLDPTCDELRTPSDLVNALQLNLGSVTAFLKALKVQAAEKEQKGYWAGFDEKVGLMGHKTIWQRLIYSRRDWALDSLIYTEVYVNAVYKGEKLRYVQLVEHYNSDYAGHYETRELMKYVDSAYGDHLLLPYNEKHETNFTWKDLFEDDLHSFTTFSELVSVRYYDHPDGSGRDSVFLSGGMLKFWPMIRDLDHLAVVRNCKSINPVRKAYGLVCLYIWQQRGEILSLEELKLLKTMVKLKDTIVYTHGCRYNPAAKISNVLTEKELQRIYASIYRVWPTKTQTSAR